MFEVKNHNAPASPEAELCPLCDLHCTLALPWCNKGTAYKFGLIDESYKPLSLGSKIKHIFQRLVAFMS